MKKTLLGMRALMSVPKDNPGLVKAQYLALSRQLPMMYFILLINTLMLAVTHDDDWQLRLDRDAVHNG